MLCCNMMICVDDCITSLISYFMHSLEKCCVQFHNLLGLIECGVSIS